MTTRTIGVNRRNLERDVEEPRKQELPGSVSIFFDKQHRILIQRKPSNKDVEKKVSTTHGEVHK